MKLMVGFEIDMPDTLAAVLIRTAGANLAQADYPLALALAALGPFPNQMRDFLLDPLHTAIEPGVQTLLTTDASKIDVSLTLLVPEPENPVWITPPATPKQPAASSTPQPRPEKATRSRSDSSSRSKPTKRSRKH